MKVKKSTYFKATVIPVAKNYNYAMTTLPYINPPREVEIDTQEPDLKAYKEPDETVGELPQRFRNYMKYAED